MANINLLPWRDEHRQEKKREFFSILMLLVLFSCLVAFIWFTMTKASITNQEKRNQLLKSEIAELDQKVKDIDKLKTRREELETRIQIIQDLQLKRPLVVRYFDEMVRSVPEGLYFNSLSRKADTFSVKGVTESNNRVSALMRNLDRSDWYQAPNLKNVVSDSFEMTVQSVTPNDSANEGSK
jgi:type IV pilus assembly protein PilN